MTGGAGAMVERSPQQRAVEAPPGPTLVVAGPGAGKTWCLIERIRFLIRERGLPPDRILAVTYTNRAAGEIAERLGQGGGPDAGLVVRGTLHSICLRILRSHPAEAGLERGFGVADEDYQIAVLRQMGLPLRHCKPVLTALSRLKRGLGAGTEFKFDLAAVGAHYRRKLATRNLVDFDDLLLLTRDLLDRHPAILEAVASRWDAVLVDEFQDLNPTQYDIIRLLVDRHREVFAVGDDEQSIFSWTGADPGVLVRFQQDFGVAEPIVLDRNRRCSAAIFAAARRVLALNPQLFDKVITAERDSRHPVRVAGFATDREEIAWLVEEIVARRGQGDWGEIAVLYREHKLGDPLEQALLRAGIPVRVARGRALADDDLVAEVLGALAVIVAPDDPARLESLARRVLSRQLINEVESRAGRGRNRSLLQALLAFAEGAVGAEEDRATVRRFIRYVRSLPGLARSESTLSGLVDALLLNRPARPTSLLAKHALELTDPMEYPGARELAAALGRVQDAGGAVHLPRGGGLDLALGGLLRAARLGLRTAGPTDPLRPDDLDLRSGTASPVQLFKALQLLSARDVSEYLSDCVVFDIEATSDRPEIAETIEIGACRVRDGQVVETFHQMVRPAGPIPPESTEVHGITDADVADAPAFAQAWEAFRDFVGDDILVAHNGLGYDMPVLERQAREAGYPVARPAVFDTLLLSRRVLTGGHRLEDLAGRFKVPTGTSHRALDDARTLAGVLDGLNRARRAWQRRAAFPSGLDWLGLALAIAPADPADQDAGTLFGLARFYTLGRYGEALVQYQDAVASGMLEAPVPVRTVIDRLGGERLLARLRTNRDPAQRYPVSTARLQALIEDLAGQPLAAGVQALLDRAALSRSDGTEVAAGQVNLLTLHAAKGLEFDRVFISGVENDLIPGWRTLRDGTIDELEEQRRLLYVGMTRARDELILTRCEIRGDRPTGGTMLLDELGIPIEKIDPAGSSGAAGAQP